MKTKVFTAIIHKEEDIFVSECTEIGTVSQGFTIEEALSNLKEATEEEIAELLEVRRPLSGRYYPVIEKFVKSNWKYAILHSADENEAMSAYNGLRIIVSGKRLPIRISKRGLKIALILTGELKK